MTDEEREKHIADCGALMLRAHAQGDVKGAQGWLKLQESAIRGRSQEQVRRMEAERGLLRDE